MLAHEKEDELHLLSAVPDWWLGEGQQIRVRRAPTHFGEMDLTVRGEAKGVRVDFHIAPGDFSGAPSADSRSAPSRVVLHLPASRPLVEPIAGVEVVTRTDQKKRWDFPTVVDLYMEDAAELFKPIPGLVALPIEPSPESRWRTLDLAPVANTDPLTAPFGVPQKPDSRLLFTGLEFGRQTIGGVPFEIVDPAENDGRSFVVLHSPRAPADRTWPREVEIPVGDPAKRAFFLGNIHGWSSQDPGTGEWGAVAEYAIHYADGQVQTVPLITGRTIDEWTGPPVSDEAYAGLRTDNWHLNVVGAALRPVPIRKIVFRDLGTTAAPVLAAVTLEK
jgi:hypothetical protein